MSGISPLYHSCEGRRSGWCLEVLGISGWISGSVHVGVFMSGGVEEYSQVGCSIVGDAPISRRAEWKSGQLKAGAIVFSIRRRRSVVLFMR